MHDSTRNVRLSVLTSIVVVPVTLLGLSVAALGAETATSLQMSSCPVFAGPAWTSPMPPNNSGNKYLVTLVSVVTIDGGKKKVIPPATCAQAQTWVLKLAAEHIAGKPMLPDYPPLKTGPPGFLCKGTPDNNGHAWRGNCYKNGSNPAPTFNWTDS
jgi:hypothetical protein